MNDSMSNRLYEIADNLARSTPGFFDKKGPGAGNRATNEFMNELGARAESEFGVDYSEKHICGENSLAVDFYFPSEKAIVEIALGLRNPNTEFEKDILKVVMAISNGNPVSKLLFVSKPGAISKCHQPGRQAVTAWVEANSGITVQVLELGAT